MGSLIEPEQHVLSTLERDGSRRWLKPKLSRGRLLSRRRLVAYGLIGLYTLLPLIHLDGEPFVLLDIVARRFTIFGFTFLPTDTLLLALVTVGGLLGLFLLTALFGRVWCGWACPHTVYMEFVFRPLERLFEGTRGKGGEPRKPVAGGRKLAQYASYVVVAWILANTFVAYFVGIKELGRWMLRSPFEHPVPFVLMAAVTAAMLFHFGFFREQLCIIACPYGRLQSGLLDEHSLIVAYDARRGEPRGKKINLPIAGAAPVGDCVDCGLCVSTCPTGIDIRAGLQMECVNCAQCIDACDAVMAKVGRQPGLIRYSSQSVDAGGKKTILRMRTIAYPLILAAIATVFVLVLHGKQPFDAVILRAPGQPFVLDDRGNVRNQLRIKLTNRSDDRQAYVVTAVDAEIGIELPIELVLEPDETEVFPLSILARTDQLSGGQRKLTLEIVEQGGTGRQIVECTLLGPATAPTAAPPTKAEAS